MFSHNILQLNPTMLTDFWYIQYMSGRQYRQPCPQSDYGSSTQGSLFQHVSCCDAICLQEPPSSWHKPVLPIHWQFDQPTMQRGRCLDSLQGPGPHLNRTSTFMRPAELLCFILHISWTTSSDVTSWMVFISNWQLTNFPYHAAQQVQGPSCLEWVRHGWQLPSGTTVGHKDCYILPTCLSCSGIEELKNWV
jgi:hypothetical protein